MPDNAAIGQEANGAVDSAPVARAHRITDGKRTDFADRSQWSQLPVQRGLYAGPSELVPRDLYSEVLEGDVSRKRNGVTLEPFARLSGNTYFGRFPASYWQRWTNVKQVTVQAIVTGAGQLAVRASDVSGQQRTVAVRTVDAAKGTTITLDARIDKFLDGGALWLDLESAGRQSLTVEGVHWTVKPPDNLRTTAMTICTMNRGDDCLANLRVLAGDRPALDVLTAIYVVDHGDDPVCSRKGFSEVAAMLGTRLHYLRQPNLGGAGGFTRGIYEVAGDADTERWSVLFMDDDVLLEPDMVIRMTAFAHHAANPIIIGGQMLNLLHPDQLHIGAEYARLNTLEPGKPVKHSLVGADLLGANRYTGKRNRQERRLDAGYNGWWSCLIPSEVVNAIGYPMPFFFQWDDIEYGYRARKHGFPTVTLPGTGVWHADFDWKDWDEWYRYFNLRNSIITAALHSRFDLTLLVRVLMAQLVRCLLGVQYGLAATVIKAVEDFLKGPAILADGGAAAAREIREIRAQYPETLRHPATDAARIASNDIEIINSGAPPILPRIILLHRLFMRLMGKHRHVLGAIPSDEAYWWHSSLFETAIVTDASQEGVRVRRYNRERMFDLGARGVTVLARLWRGGRAVQSQYKQAMPNLASRQNWKRLFDL